MHRRAWIIGLMTALVIAAEAEAQGAGSPRPVELHVDASEVGRNILHARLAIPAAPGPLALFYPRWIPGEHGPTGPITDLAGLKISAGARAVRWHRDEIDMYTIHCRVPEGVETIEVVLDFLSAPRSARGFSWAASATTQLAVINWNQVLLYPRGRPADEIGYRVTLTLPEGWKLGTALPIESQSAPVTRFAPVSLETLIDSPALCGRHFREVPIGPPGGPRHFIEMAADGEHALSLDPALKAKYDRMVAEAGALFGARHYNSYRFLLALSDNVSSFGLEHHESSDNRTPERMLIDDSLRLRWALLLPHEFIHSWNGKYRRPADMVRTDYQQPLRTNLLWVYEGLTHYLTFVLTTRSGLWTPEQCREHLALVAEWADNQRGRSWRPLEDTAVSAQLLFGARSDWSSWRRGVDFYREGVLIWMEVDAIIRQETHGRRSLDDFCRTFFGGEDGPPAVRPYTFDDLVAGLNSVAAYDWKSLLTERVASIAAEPPTGGLERCGWRLAYADTPSEYQNALEKAGNETDLTASIGLRIAEDGSITDVIPGKAADLAGVAPAAKLVAVNRRRWSPELLKLAISAAKENDRPIELLMENDDFFASHALDYHDGEKYPRLKRDSSKADLLTQILKPIASAGKTSRLPE